MLRAIRETPAGRQIEIILHTPGGLVLAASQIAVALADHDGPVTAVVPHYAMSGGTMIALAADEVVLEPHAALGPVDPQLGHEWRISPGTGPGRCRAPLARLLDARSSADAGRSGAARLFRSKIGVPQEERELLELYPQPRGREGERPRLKPKPERARSG